MSLDIHLETSDGRRSYAMNWLRNPYGLCQWIEDNARLPEDVRDALVLRAQAHDEKESEEEKYPKTVHPASLLWFVINRWCYDKAPQIDRKLFLDVVKAYAAEVEKLDQGYYFFGFGAYRQFVEPHRNQMPSEATQAWAFGGAEPIAGEVWHRENGYERLAIPMEHFKRECFHLAGHNTLVYYKEWTRHLAEFAEALQAPSVTFYGSN
jgi:hypothetical protein